MAFLLAKHFVYTIGSRPTLEKSTTALKTRVKKSKPAHFPKIKKPCRNLEQSKIAQLAPGITNLLLSKAKWAGELPQSL